MMKDIPLLIPVTVFSVDGKQGPTYGNIFCYYCNWDVVASGYRDFKRWKALLSVQFSVSPPPKPWEDSYFESMINDSYRVEVVHPDFKFGPLGEIGDLGFDNLTYARSHRESSPCLTSVVDENILDSCMSFSDNAKFPSPTETIEQSFSTEWSPEARICGISQRNHFKSLLSMNAHVKERCRYGTNFVCIEDLANLQPHM